MRPRVSARPPVQRTAGHLNDFNALRAFILGLGTVWAQPVTPRNHACALRVWEPTRGRAAAVCRPDLLIGVDTVNVKAVLGRS